MERRNVGRLAQAGWDPITGVPLSEYDTYVPAIWRLLDGQAGVEEISAELSRIRVKVIGLDADASRDHEAAGRLIEWWCWHFEYPKKTEAKP